MPTPLHPSGDDAPTSSQPSAGAISGTPHVGALRGLWTKIASFAPSLGRADQNEPSTPPSSETTGGVPVAVLDAFPDPVFVVDADDRVRAANSAVQDVLGYDPQELIGAGLAETLFPPPLREAHRARLREADTSMDIQGDRISVRAANGSAVSTEVSIRSVQGGGQRLFGVYLRDVRETQAADDRRRTLRTIVDSIPDPVVAVDRSFRVIFRNQAALQGPDESSEGTDHTAAPTWRQDADAVMESGTPVFDQEEPTDTNGIQTTTRVPVRDRAGTVVGLVAISRDVTSQKMAEAKLLDDMRAAEAAAHANREFLATTSHEVRTLMSGVTGMTTLLRGTDLDEEQLEFVDTIHTSSGALLKVINDVLDFTKIEAGMLALESEPFEVRKTVEEAMRMVAQQGNAKGLNLAYAVSRDVPDTVHGDSARVRQVLVNLLSNAVKFTDEGSVRIRVQRVPSESGDTLSFSVEDTGVGIAPERLDAMFERFTQQDASTARTHGGTGLGLAICRQLVQIMGGELSAESVPGEGSTFRFSVSVGDPSVTRRTPPPPGADGPAQSVWLSRPAADATTPIAEAPLPSAPELAMPERVVPEPTPEEEPEEPSESTPGVVMSMDAILPSARVLLAEDNPVNQRVAVLTLRRLGYRPDVVSNGAEAVEVVRRHPYDVVLMDIMMPVMTGLEATRAIRSDPGSHPAPAIVALTANAMEGDRKECLDAGCDDYLAKPAAPQLLAATIERAVRSRDVSPAEA